MDAQRVTEAARRYFERMLGLPLRKGSSAAYSAAVEKSCPPFLLGCAVAEFTRPGVSVRAVAPGLDGAFLVSPPKKGRRTDYIAYIPGGMPLSGGAVAIPPGASVSGSARIPNPDCAFGVQLRDRFVSWASAAPLGEIWNITVETAPAQRGKGYARQALLTLTAHLLAHEKPPLYICEAGNIASARTALAAGFVEYGRFARVILPKEDRLHST